MVDEILEQVAQTGSGCPIPPNVQVQVEQDSVQPDLVVDVAAHCKVVGVGDLFKIKIHSCGWGFGTRVLFSFWDFFFFQTETVQRDPKPRRLYFQKLHCLKHEN